MHLPPFLIFPVHRLCMKTAEEGCEGLSRRLLRARLSPALGVFG